MGADGVQDVDSSADPDQHEVVDARPGLRGGRLGQRFERVELADVELDPFGPGAAKRVPADHVAQDIHDIAADIRPGGDDQGADQR